MSLMAKLTQSWNDDIDSLRDAIVDNVCDLISSRAPLCSEMFLSEKGTIAEFGMRNMPRAQSKTIPVTLSQKLKCLSETSILV